MNQITIDGNRYFVNEKTLKLHQKKLKALKRQNGIPALAIYVAILFFVFGVWVLGYQTILWLKTDVWQNLPWYQTIFKSEPVTLHYLASINLWLIFVIMSVVSYYSLKYLLPTTSLKSNISHLEKVVNKLREELN
ncbi:hypothetical protein ACFL3P_01510 [Pseudomonadota bacterium]